MICIWTRSANIKNPFIIVLLFNVVVPETFNDDKCVEALLNIVNPDTYNDVFIDVPAEFNRIASHVP